MPDARPDFATEMREMNRPHAEVIDPQTREVWQTLDACEPEEFATLELPAPLRPVGTGHGAMDEHWFDRSPGATSDGPMRTRRFAGREWGHCATPGASPSHPFGETGPMELTVDKHHALRFAAGRRVLVLKTAEGEAFVQVIAGGEGSTVGLAGATPASRLVLPEGCVLGAVALEHDWGLRLPNPTRALFFKSGDSFQGPLTSLPANWEEVG